MRILLILLLLINTVMAGPGTWPKAGKIFVSKNALFFKGGDVRITTGDTDNPMSVAKFGDEGSLYIQDGTGALFQKQDTGISTDWLPLLIGPTAAVTDECVARWDGTVGVLQNSVFCITEAGVASGATQLNVDNLRLDGNTISSTDVNGNIILNPNGTGKVILPLLTSDRLVLSSSGSPVELSAMTNGQIVIGQTASSPIVALMSSEATMTASGAVTLSNPAVIGKVITGFTSGAGVLAATDTLLQSIQKLDGNNVETDANVDDLIILSGVVENATNLGTFTGTTIADSVTNKVALQSLETEVETKLASTLVSARIFVGNASNVATSVAMSGDVNINNVGLTTIQAGAVSLTNDISGILPNTNGGTGQDSSGFTGVAKVSAGVWSASTLVDADVNAAANITATKLGTGVVDNTEFNLLDGRTYIPNVAGTADQLSYFIGINTTAALGPMTDGRMVIGSTAASPVIGTIGATTDQTTVTIGPGTLTIGTVQDIGTSSLVEFGQLNLLAQGDLRLEDAADGEYVAIQAPATVVANYTFTLPPDGGEAGRKLTTDGAGVTTWEPASGAGGINALDDPSFESDVSNVTVGAGNAKTQEDTVFYHPISGGKSLKIVTDTAVIDAKQISTFTEWANTSVEVSCFIKSNSNVVRLCSSDDANDILCVNYDGSDLWKKVVTSMIVPADGKMGWHLISDASTSATTYIDECVVSELKPSVDAAIGGTTTYALTAANTQGWGTPSSVDVYHRRVGDKLEIWGTFISGVVTADEAQLDLPNGLIIKSGVSAQMSGIWFRGATSLAHGGTVIMTGGDTFLNFGSGGTFGDFSVNAMEIKNGSNTVGNTEQMSFHAWVPIQGWASSTQFLTQSFDWYVDVKLSGAVFDLRITTVTPSEGMENGSITLTNNTDFNNVAPACELTSEAAIGDTDCGIPDESNGIKASGWVGDVDVCVTFSAGAQLDEGEQLIHNFKLVKTGNTNQTVEVSGVEQELRSGTVTSTNLVNLKETKIVTLCKIFSMNGTSTFRLFYKQTVVGAVDASRVEDGVHWRITPVSGVMFAKLNPVKYQKKKLTEDAVSSGTLNDLTFNNLVIGATYRVFLQVLFYITGNATETVTVVHNGVTLTKVSHREDIANLLTSSTQAIFTATATTLTFSYSTAGNADVNGNDTFSETWAMIEELPTHIETSEF